MRKLTKISVFLLLVIVLLTLFVTIALAADEVTLEPLSYQAEKLKYDNSFSSYENGEKIYYGASRLGIFHLFYS